MGENVVAEKSFAFALKIVNVYKHLSVVKKEFVLSKQLLKSGTSIGANVREAIFAQSKKDFISKMNIALKEASETEYWLELLCQSGYLENAESDVRKDCRELKKLLCSIVKSSKVNS